jgi:hypothetical protein
VLRDIANLAVAGLVFGQFLADRPFSMKVVSAGIVVWMASRIVVTSARAGAEPCMGCDADSREL